jgi:hypothetical protein
MLDKGCFLVLVVRRLHSPQTRPPPTGSLWQTANPHTAPPLVHARHAYKLVSLVSDVGRKLPLTSSLFSTTPFNFIIFN